MSTLERPTAPRLRRWGIRLAKAAVAALALALTWQLLAGLDWADLAHRMAAASWPLLAAALACQIVRYGLWDWRFRLAARRAAELRTPPFLGCSVLLASAALNLITPSARVVGGPLRARYFARATSRPFGLLYGVVLFDQLAHYAVMTAITWISVAVAAWHLGHPGWGGAALGALAAAVLGLAVWDRRRGAPGPGRLAAFLERRAGRGGRLRALYRHGHEAVAVLVRLIAARRLRAPVALLGLAFFFVTALSQWLVFAALDYPVSVLVVMAVVALGNAAGMMTGTPGGVGTTEAAMVGAFAALGVDRVDAAAATVLFRGIHYAGILAFGVPALLVLEARLGGRRAPEEGEVLPGEEAPAGVPAPPTAL